MPYNFQSASKEDNLVYGSSRPGYSLKYHVDKETVLTWIKFIKSKGIKRICCLLDSQHLDYYSDNLITIYENEFGKDNICHAPVEDYSLVDKESLHNVILPFINESVIKQSKVLVHCSAGIGRTGIVLASWLVYYRNYEPKVACAEVENRGRSPLGNLDSESVYTLLRSCQRNEDSHNSNHI